MNKETLLELLFANNFKKTLKFIRRYQAYMNNGISYDDIKALMEHDYKVFLEKEYKKEKIDVTLKDAIYKINELNNISTNIESRDDAICKFKALSLAKQNIDEQ